MRIRKHSKHRSAVKFIGKFPSLKLNRTVLWGSQLVRDFLYLLEFDPDVLSYREQPMQLDYVHNSVQYGYIPSFLVKRSKNQQIIEVKSEEQLGSEAATIKYRLIASILRQEGYDFYVVTDKTIRVQPRLDNIKFLWKYARTPITPQHQILCHNLMRRNHDVAFSEVVQFFESHHAPRQVVYALMYRGAFTFDLMQPIDSKTILQLSAIALADKKVS